jgi:hypothetical protein
MLFPLILATLVIASGVILLLQFFTGTLDETSTIGSIVDVDDDAPEALRPAA